MPTCSSFVFHLFFQTLAFQAILLFALLAGVFQAGNATGTGVFPSNLVEGRNHIGTVVLVLVSESNCILENIFVEKDTRT